jgi:hypothetical protein
MGVYDVTKAALKELDAEIFFERVALRPGKPTVFARLPNGNARVWPARQSSFSCGDVQSLRAHGAAGAARHDRAGAPYETGEAGAQRERKRRNARVILPAQLMTTTTAS